MSHFLNKTQLACLLVIAILTIVAAVAIVSIRRDIQLWDIDVPYREIVYLEPGGSVSQVVETSVGTVVGFAALVRPVAQAGQTRANMRIRRPGEASEILRESVQVLVGDTRQVIGTGVLAPIPASRETPLEFELESSPSSGAGFVVLGLENSTNIPPGRLTINSAPTLFTLSALVSPIVNVSTRSLVLNTFAFDPLRSAAYALAMTVALAAGVGASAAMAGSTLTAFHWRRFAMALLVLLPALVGLVMALSTALFPADYGEDYKSGLLVAYWGTSMGISWLASWPILTGWAARSWILRQSKLGVGLGELLQPAQLWRPLAALSALILALVIALAYLRLEVAGNVAGSVAGILLAFSLILGMIASLRTTS